MCAFVGTKLLHRRALWLEGTAVPKEEELCGRAESDIHASSGSPSFEDQQRVSVSDAPLYLLLCCMSKLCVAERVLFSD